MDELASFRTFRTREEAQAFAAELEQLGFLPALEDNSKYMSSAFVGAAPDYFSVKLAPEDFLKAEEALEDAAEREIAEVEEDHYLFSFSDSELLEVVRKSDEWNAFDRRLARKIMAERGVPVASPQVVNTYRSEVLAEPAPPQTRRVIRGYALAVLGGVFGIFIGHHLNTAKKTLPDGRRVYIYRADDRSHGKWIFCIGVVVCLVLMWKYLATL